MSWGTFCDNCDTVDRGRNNKRSWRSYCMPMTEDESNDEYGRQEEVEFCSRKCVDQWMANHPEA